VGGCVKVLSWRWREPSGGSLIRPRRPHALSARRHPHSQHAYTHHAPARAEGARATSSHAHSPSKSRPCTSLISRSSSPHGCPQKHVHAIKSNTMSKYRTDGNVTSRRSIESHGIAEQCSTALPTTSRAVCECDASIPRVRIWGYTVPADIALRQAGRRAFASTGVRNGTGTGAGTSAECCLGFRAIERSQWTALVDLKTSGARLGLARPISLWILAGAKSTTYAPDRTCTRRSVLRIAGYGTAVLP